MEEENKQEMHSGHPPQEEVVQLQKQSEIAFELPPIKSEVIILLITFISS